MKTRVTCVLVLGSPELNLEPSVATEGRRRGGSKMDYVVEEEEVK